MSKPTELTMPMTLRRFFGGELARLREAAGLSQRELAPLIAYSLDMLRAVEQGKRVPTKDFTERCDAELNSGGLLGRLWPLVHMARLTTQIQDYIDMEAQARSLRSFELQVIPGLLQQEPYIRAIQKAARESVFHGMTPDEALAVRLERQAILRRSNPPVFWTVLDESVLRRRVGNEAIMRGQLSYVADIADPPNVIVQILPLIPGANVPLVGSFIGMSFAEGDDVFYMDSIAGGGRFVSDPDDLEWCNLCFDLIRAAALPADTSVALIKKAVKEIWS
jgi:transcriptional regulator with XRE-family HTH domain